VLLYQYQYGVSSSTNQQAKNSVSMALAHGSSSGVKRSESAAAKASWHGVSWQRAWRPQRYGVSVKSLFSNLVKAGRR